MDRSELRSPVSVPRAERVGANLMKALAPLVSDWARGLGLMVSVTHVDVSPDLKNAKVAVSVLGAAADLKGVTAALNAEAGQFRHALSSRVRMKTLPRLRFVADDTIATSARIDRLLSGRDD